ncbi:MAG: TetR/AcrR family transcriptional regulator [Thermoleophilaceae bacterium]|nr:TetR/AcrR family transcriptional regulator [Thermoleophilaceae bacterium]
MAEAVRKRQRLGADERRQQLIDIGTRMFASRAYDDVWVQEVAKEAGVSRGLLYHYFPDKRDFFAAVLGQSTHQFDLRTDPASDLPPFERLRAGLDAYIAYAADSPDRYRAIHRSVTTADPELRAIVEHNIQRQEERLLSAMEFDPKYDAILGLAVRGWVSAVIACCLDWLDNASVSAEELRELLAVALISTVQAILVPPA